MENKTNRRAGFTLIELLVVISIIALLMSILMPALTKVRDQAKKTICSTRLRDIGTALHLYRADQDDKLPPSWAFDEHFDARLDEGTRSGEEDDLQHEASRYRYGFPFVQS